MAQDRASSGAAAPRAARPALAALAGAWLHGWAQRPDPRPTWQDAAILAGLLAGWLLGRAALTPGAAALTPGPSPKNGRGEEEGRRPSGRR